MSQPVIEITVNGEPRVVAQGTTILGLLGELGLADKKRVAVECNRRVVPRASRGAVRLSSGDRLEIVGFVGGG